MHTMVCTQTSRTRRHVEPIMSDTKTPQQGTGAKPSSQQQGQQPPAPVQQQGSAPVIRDWASI
jgi:hypothetical protein